MCAQELGRGDIKSLNRVFSSVFYIAGVVSVIIMSVELIFAKQLAYLFGATGEGIGLAVLATDYIRGLAIGFPALVLTVIVASGCQLDSGRKRVMKATIIYCGSNIAFDILAIVLNTGEFGIGLATSLGTEKAMRRLSNVIAPILVNKIIIYYGGISAMTAMAVQKNVLDFAGFMAIGLADATSLQVGVLYGEKDDEAIREVGHCVHKYCGQLICIVTILFIALSHLIAAVYISDRGEMFRMAVFSVCITGLYAPVYAFVRTRIAYLQAIHKTKNM